MCPMQQLVCVWMRMMRKPKSLRFLIFFMTLNVFSSLFLLKERLKKEYKSTNKQRDTGVDESDEEEELPGTSKGSEYVSGSKDMCGSEYLSGSPDVMCPGGGSVRQLGGEEQD